MMFVVTQGSQPWSLTWSSHSACTSSSHLIWYNRESCNRSRAGIVESVLLMRKMTVKRITVTCSKQTGRTPGLEPRSRTVCFLLLRLLPLETRKEKKRKRGKLKKEEKKGKRYQEKIPKKRKEYGETKGKVNEEEGDGSRGGRRARERENKRERQVWHQGDTSCYQLPWWNGHVLLNSHSSEKLRKTYSISTKWIQLT